MAMKGKDFIRPLAIGLVAGFLGTMAMGWVAMIPAVGTFKIVQYGIGIGGLVFLTEWALEKMKIGR